MHSIFLITPKEDDTIRPVQSVYTQKITARLKQEAGLVTDVYINRDNIDRFLVRRVGGGRRVFDMEHAGVFKRRNCVLFSEFKSSFL